MSINTHFQRPSAPVAYPAQEDASRVFLSEGESLSVAAGAMAAFCNMDVVDDIWKRSFRTLCVKIAFRVASSDTYTAKKGGGWIDLEQHQPGQIQRIPLPPGGTKYIIHPAHHMACQAQALMTVANQPEMSISKVIPKIRVTIGAPENQPESFTYVRALQGRVQKLSLREEEGSIIVDNNALIAHSETLKVTAKQASGLISSFFSGEGIVYEVSGTGDLYLDTAVQSNEVNLFQRYVINTASSWAKWAGAIAIWCAIGIDVEKIAAAANAVALSSIRQASACIVGVGCY